MIVLGSVSAVRAIRLDLSLDARAQGLVATRKGTTRNHYFETGVCLLHPGQNEGKNRAEDTRRDSAQVDPQRGLDPGALGRIAAADQRPERCNGFNARSEQKHSAGDKTGEIASGTKL